MARKIIPILIFLVLAVGYAHALGVGGEGLRFGRLGAISNKKAAAVGQTGDILMVDGASLILQTDGASFVCLAGGC